VRIPTMVVLVLGITAWLPLPTKSQQCKSSVLANINCGGYQATCFQSKSGATGAVRCTCTATCSSPESITASVAATRAVQWGQNSPCSSSLYGQATGDTTGTINNPTVASSVYVQVSLSGNYAGGPYQSSTQQVDCFLGTVTDSPVITGLC
jgi:hypothetical protein